MKNIEPSPLCIGCRKGNVAVVDYLLKNGADAAFVDHDGDTALHIAVERVGLQANPEEYHTIVTLLLQSELQLMLFPMREKRRCTHVLKVLSV